VTAFYDRQPLHELYISILSIAEIRFGIELQEDAARRAEFNDRLTLTLLTHRSSTESRQTIR
jgi:hypothetical protein